MPATIGRVRRPDSVAETPSTNCMNVGRNVNAPSIANPTMNARMQHTVNTGLANSRIGRIGSAAWDSTHTKIASASSGTDEQTDDHRRRPGVRAAAPAGGQRQTGGGDADEQDARVVDDRPCRPWPTTGWPAVPTTNTTSAIGTLIQNAHRQVR